MVLCAREVAALTVRVRDRRGGLAAAARIAVVESA